MLDITKRKEAEEQIAFLAYHDKLTGLPNRVLFDELLELSLARARRHELGVAVISVDIDNFKLVNDSLGHEAGDELIVLVAERLSRGDARDRPGCTPGRRRVPDAARRSGAHRRPFRGRLGRHRGRVRRRRASRHALRQPFEVAGTELYVTASARASASSRSMETTPRRS